MKTINEMIFQVSNRNQTHLINRDRNAVVNMAQIIRSLLDFGKIPWEFRKDTVLRKHEAYTSSRKYSYSAKVTDDDGQIMKFSRVRKVGSG